MDVLTVDYYQKDAPKRFTDSLKNTGFCVLETHPIDWQLIETIYQEWRDFMMSDAVKAYQFDQAKQDGYFPMDISETAKGQDSKDIKHFYHLYFPWGRYPKEVSDRAKQLFDQLFELGKTLLQWIDDYMDPSIAAQLPGKLADTVDYQQTLLRILHYPALSGQEDPNSIRAAAHEDINLITLLPSASAPGLEVYSPFTEQWYEVPYKNQSIIINIGDMLQEQYIATTHRVKKPADDDGSDRVSTPCFIHPKPTVYLSERYPQASDFLEERLRELGVK